LMNFTAMGKNTKGLGICTVSVIYSTV